MTSSARHTVWSLRKDSTFEVRREGPLAGPLSFSAASGRDKARRVASMFTITTATRRPLGVDQTTLRQPRKSPSWPNARQQRVKVE
jgi:hypothetical protein